MGGSTIYAKAKEGITVQHYRRQTKWCPYTFQTEFRAVCAHRSKYGTVKVYYDDEGEEAGKKKKKKRKKKNKYERCYQCDYWKDLFFPFQKIRKYRKIVKKKPEKIKKVQKIIHVSKPKKIKKVAKIPKRSIKKITKT